MATTEPLPLSTPGEILRREFPEPLGLAANALAAALRVPANRITAILNGTRGITADTALRLGRYFGTTAVSGREGRPGLGIGGAGIRIDR